MLGPESLCFLRAGQNNNAYPRNFADPMVTASREMVAEGLEPLQNGTVPEVAHTCGRCMTSFVIRRPAPGDQVAPVYVGDSGFNCQGSQFMVPGGEKPPGTEVLGLNLRNLPIVSGFRAS